MADCSPIAQPKYKTIIHGWFRECGHVNFGLAFGKGVNFPRGRFFQELSQHGEGLLPTGLPCLVHKRFVW